MTATYCFRRSVSTCVGIHNKLLYIRVYIETLSWIPTHLDTDAPVTAQNSSYHVRVYRFWHTRDSHITFGRIQQLWIPWIPSWIPWIPSRGNGEIKRVNDLTPLPRCGSLTVTDRRHRSGAPGSGRQPHTSCWLVSCVVTDCQLRSLSWGLSVSGRRAPFDYLVGVCHFQVRRNRTLPSS